MKQFKTNNLQIIACQENIVFRLQIKIKSNYFIVRLKVDQRAGQLSLPHLGITKTKNRTKT